MCLAIPFKVKEINGNMAMVELNGVRREISIAMTPEVKIERWVLVHAGYSIQEVNEEEARETLRLLEDMHEAIKDK
jgi:hydrogenase expression/formation protein HypC